MIEAALIDRARSVRIEDELSRRGIKLRGRNGALDGPCPICGGTDRFAVSLKKQVFNCRGCGARGGDAIALVRFLDGLGFKDAVELISGEQPPQGDYHQFAPAPRPPDRSDDDKNRARAGSIWRDCIDPRGTLPHVYLGNRKLDLPDEIAGSVIRFHPNCPFGEGRFPAMICLVRSISRDRPQAIIRTALTSNGYAIKHNNKTLRMSLGPTKDGAVKIDPNEAVTQGLCVGEGLETCLAGRQMGLRPVWALLGTAGVAGFPVLLGIDGLHIFRENDANLAGPKSVEDCAARWRAAGRDVRIADPGYGVDLNDELAGAAA